MGFLDTLKKIINGLSSEDSTSAKQETQKKTENKSVSFTFGAIPKTLDELKALPESSLDTPFKTTALAILALCNFENDKDATFEMLDFLNGPYEVNPLTKQFYNDRLNGKFYKTFSFFEGATPDNSYAPNVPYKIAVSDNPYSYDEENWCTLYVKSSGADAVRPVKLRKKPSTNQWFIADIQCLSDIRVPATENPWA